MKRRNFIQAMLVAGVAPAAIGSGILMPVKKLITPPPTLTSPDNLEWFIVSYLDAYGEQRKERIGINGTVLVPWDGTSISIEAHPDNPSVGAFRIEGRTA